MQPPPCFTVADLRSAYADGLSPAAVVAEAYRRLRTAEDPGIFITLLPEDAAHAAAASLGRYDPGRPLWGVPFAVGTYTNFVNLLDLCALSVPGRFRADGFPSGATLIAPAGRERASPADLR